MKGLEKIGEWVAGVLLLALVLVAIAGVVMRYFFNSPLHWGEEMTGLLMAWIVLIGMAIAERKDSNLTITFITDVLPQKLSAWIALLVSVLSIVLLVYMAWLGYQLASASGFRQTQILKISWFWIYIAVPVGALWTACFTVPQGIRAVRALRDRLDSRERV